MRIGGQSSSLITPARWATVSGTVSEAIGEGSAFSASTSTSTSKPG